MVTLSTHLALDAQSPQLLSLVLSGFGYTDPYLQTCCERQGGLTTAIPWCALMPCRCLMKASKRMLSKALMSFVEAVDARKGLEANLRGISQRWIKLAMAEAFSCWLDNAIDMMEQREMMRAILDKVRGLAWMWPWRKGLRVLRAEPRAKWRFSLFCFMRI